LEEIWSDEEGTAVGADGVVLDPNNRWKLMYDMDEEREGDVFEWSIWASRQLEESTKPNIFEKRLLLS
jgi:hypothetical protein